MKNSQWIFECGFHNTPKECPAIDYVRHTLDGATDFLYKNQFSFEVIALCNIFASQSLFAIYKQKNVLSTYNDIYTVKSRAVDQSTIQF